MSPKKTSKKNDLILANVLEQLHKNWNPFKAQALILKKVFIENKDVVFVECGRKFGKTELLCYILWRYALMNPKTYCYYFTPHANQCKEILWASRRIQDFGPAHFLKGKPNDSEMRVNFVNGSFIKLDGSDNFDRHRGTNPHIVVYDEFKDFRPEFHMIMEPNLSTYKAPCIICGTPPEETECQFITLADQAAKLSTQSYFNFPSWTNPNIDREWLKKKKDELYARGEGVVFEREYGAKRIFGGPGVIFPMFNEKTMVLPHEKILRILYRDRHKLEWLAIADPGTATCFAMLYMAVNSYKKTVYLLDEIYETQQAETSTSKIIPRHRRIKADLIIDVDDWLQVADEAETWFINEAWQSFSEPFTPTQKHSNKKEDGISLIKDIMLKNNFFMSERCIKTKWELQNYIKDKNGNIPKKNDHEIDCLIGSTLIRTENGNKKISKIKIGENVYTDTVINKIEDFWKSEKRRVVIKLIFSNGSKIICTEEHKIFTENRGYVNAKDLTSIDALRYIDHEGDQKWTKKKLFSMELFLGDIQTLIGESLGLTLDVIQDTIKKALDFCIGKYGRISLEKYQKDFISIIKTRTRSTTTLKILSVFQLKIMAKKIKESVPRLREKILNQLDILRMNGINQKKEDNGTLNTEKIYGIKKKKSLGCAKNAEQHIKQKHIIKNFVQTLASLKTEGNHVLITLKEYVNLAAKYFLSTNTQKQKTVVNLVRIRKCIFKRFVYDITVSKRHSFYANTILVHNCLRYGLSAAGVTLVEENEPLNNKDDCDEEARFKRKSLESDLEDISIEEEF